MQSLLTVEVWVNTGAESLGTNSKVYHFTKSSILQTSIQEQKGPSLVKLSKFLISEVCSLWNLKTSPVKQPKQNMVSCSKTLTIERESRTHSDTQHDTLVDNLQFLIFDPCMSVWKVLCKSSRVFFSTFLTARVESMVLWRIRTHITTCDEWNPNTCSGTKMAVKTVSQKFSQPKWERFFKELWSRPNNDCRFQNNILTNSPRQQRSLLGR